MKFFELKKGQAFYFAKDPKTNDYLFLSAGVDGAYGRFVSSYVDYRDHEEWIYCSPVDEVEAEA
jgi:hypothetical protein